jgi:hypothetical protein
VFVLKEGADRLSSDSVIEWLVRRFVRLFKLDSGFGSYSGIRKYSGQENGKKY